MRDHISWPSVSGFNWTHYGSSALGLPSNHEQNLTNLVNRSEAFLDWDPLKKPGQTQETRNVPYRPNSLIQRKFDQRVLQIQLLLNLHAFSPIVHLNLGRSVSGEIFLDQMLPVVVWWRVE